MTNEKIYELWKTIKTNDVVLNKELKKMSHKNINERFTSFLKIEEATLENKRGAGQDRINALTIGQLINSFIEINQIINILVAHDGTLNAKELAIISTEIVASLEVKAFLNENNISSTIGQSSFVIRDQKLDAWIYITTTKEKKIKIILLDSNGTSFGNIIDKQLTEKMRIIPVERINFIKDKVNYISNDVSKRYENLVLDSRYRKNDSRLLNVFLKTNNAIDEIAQRIIAKSDIKFEHSLNTKYFSIRKCDLSLKVNNEASILFLSDCKSTFSTKELAILYLNYLLTQFKYKKVNTSNMFIATYENNSEIIKLAKINGITLHLTEESGIYNTFKNKNAIKDKVALMSIDENGLFLTTKTNYPDALVYMSIFIEMANYYKSQNKTLSNVNKQLKKAFKK